MITNNVIQMLKGSTVSNPSAKFKYYNGQIAYWANRDFSSFFNSDLSNSDYSQDEGLSMLVGSGNSTPTNDQYMLDNIITSYSVIAQNHTFFQADFDDRLVLVNRTIQNTSDSNIAITELGVFGSGIMIAREVLPEPVTLQPGEKHTFTMSIGLE